MFSSVHYRCNVLLEGTSTAKGAPLSKEHNAEEERPKLLEASVLLLAPIQEGVVVGMRSSPPT
jgi:hypothetical protein